MRRRFDNDLVIELFENIKKNTGVKISLYYVQSFIGDIIDVMWGIENDDAFYVIDKIKYTGDSTTNNVKGIIFLSDSESPECHQYVLFTYENRWLAYRKVDEKYWETFEIA